MNIDKLKISRIFEKGHNNRNWEKIEKWIEDEAVCAIDLMALVCAKFGQQLQVRSNERLKNETKLMVAGDIYRITIEKVKQ